MGRGAVGEGAEAAQEGALLLAEPGNVRDRLDAGRDREQAEQQGAPIPKAEDDQSGLARSTVR